MRYASELRARLNILYLERLEAESLGLTECEVYLQDLKDEISACRAALVGATITEIAIARAELSGRLVG